MTDVLLNLKAVPLFFLPCFIVAGTLLCVSVVASLF